MTRVFIKSLMLFLTLSVLILANFLIFADFSFVEFNAVESLFWVILAGLFTSIKILYGQKYKTALILLITTSLLFGLTDLIEIITGAFWDPWWLLVLNIVCVGSFAFIAIWFIANFFKFKRIIK